MQGIQSALSLPSQLADTKAFTPGSILRGRVVQSASGESFFEYAGGRIPITKNDAASPRWQSYRVEQGQTGIRLVLLPDAKNLNGQLAAKPVDRNPQTALLERALSFLYPGRKLEGRIHADKGSFAEGFLRAFFPDGAEALQEILASFHSKKPRQPPKKKNAPLREKTDGIRTDAGKQPAPCLLRLSFPPKQEGHPPGLLSADGGKDFSGLLAASGGGDPPARLRESGGGYIPLFVIPQDGEDGAPKTIWLFSEIDLDGLGHTAFCLRLRAAALDGDIYCQKGRKRNIEGCLPASLAALRVHEREQSGGLCEWALAHIIERSSGGCDSYA